MQQIFGANMVKVCKKLRIAEGINAARTLFPLNNIDEENCYELVQHLRHYRFDVDEETGQLSKEPVHDEHSHAADAFRYMALNIREPNGVDLNLAMPKEYFRLGKAISQIGAAGLGWMR
jgi:hypothetical protein